MDTKEQAAAPALDPEPKPLDKPGIRRFVDRVKDAFTGEPSPAVARVMAEGHDRETAEQILKDKAESDAQRPSVVTGPGAPAQPRGTRPAPPASNLSPATELIVSQGYSVDEAHAILSADLEGVVLACDPQQRMTMIRVIASVLHKI